MLLVAGLGLASEAYARERVQSVTGVVRELRRGGRPIAGADVLLGGKTTTTNEGGAFRIDSLAPGRYPITVRFIGYRPFRGTVPVAANEPTQLELYLVPAPQLLPTLVTEVRRRGIFGVVGDAGYRPLSGAKVALLGVGGREPQTRVAFAPGEAEALWNLDRRLVFEFKRSRMSDTELERYGSAALCDVPRVRSLGGEPTTVTSTAPPGWNR